MMMELRANGEGQVITDTLVLMNIIAEILDIQKTRKIQFLSIGIIAPFKIFNFKSFLNEVLENDISKQQTAAILQKIHDIALKNIDIYNNELKGMAPGSMQRFRIDDDYELRTMIGERGAQRFNEDPRHLVTTNYKLLRYCAGIMDFLNQSLTKDSQSKENAGQPTTNQFALFIYYLIESKEIRKPSKNEWDVLAKTYKYNKSGGAAYNHSCNIGNGIEKGEKKDPMSLKNLAFVINEMLGNYPTAKKKAENDYYTKESELR